MIIALIIGLLAIAVAMQRWVRSRERQRFPRPLDLGVVLVWVAFMYSAFPLLGILLAGWDIGSLQDERLGRSKPADSDVVQVGAMYLLFLAGFAGAYRATAVGARLAQPEQAQWSSSRDVAIVVLLLVGIKLTILVARAVLVVQTADDYLGSYIELADQPLIVRQLFGILVASELAASILAIVVVIARDPRLHRVVAVLVVAQIVVAIAGGGSRSHAFSSALAYLVARSLYDPGLRFRTIALAGAGGVLLFLVAGAIRQSNVASEDLSSLYLLQGGEFLSVFYNSLDLLDRVKDIDLGALRVGIYLVDLLRFVPQQFVGDLKLDPAVFYVSTFYPDYSEAGGGLAFGAIAEATLGFGSTEALIRGLLLGYLYARIRGACLQQRLSLMRAFVYTWFVVLAYQAVRDTTFSVFPRFFFQVLPLLVAIQLTGALKGSRIRFLDRHGRHRPADRQPSHAVPALGQTMDELPGTS